MPPEPMVPVSRLEKLSRRLRRRSGKKRLEHRAATYSYRRGFLWGEHVGAEDAAADLREVIDEAKEANDG